MRRFLRERGDAVLAALAVIALGVWALVVRLKLLLGSPYPFGVDGYWYALQARAILERGHLEMPTAPLVPWLGAAAAWLTDPFVGTKLVAALGSAAAVWPAYLLGRRVSGWRSAGVLASALVACGAGSFYLSTEFVKEGVGATLALGFLAALAACLERPGLARSVVPALLLVACVLAHKTSAGLALVLAAPLLYEMARRAGRRRVLLVLAGVAVAIALLGALAPRRFLGAHDAHLFGGILRGTAELSLAPLIRADGTRLLFQREVLMAALLSLATIVLGLGRVRDRLRLPPPPALVWGFVAFALVLAVPWLDARDADGLAYRLRLLAFIPLSILAAWVARLALAAAPAGRAAFLAAAALALITLRPLSREGMIETHPGLALVVRSFAGVVPEGAWVVCPERRVVFMAAWYARVRAATRPRPANGAASDGWRLLPEFAVTPELAALLEASPPPGVPPPRELHYLRHGLVLLREDTFQALLTRLPEATRALYLSWPTR